jgi:DNA-binding CsgD family transcriptional regulator
MMIASVQDWNRAMGRFSKSTPLTKKQSQVAALVASGHGNRAIAEMLGNSEQVIKNHVRNIFDKMGCNSRVQCAILWHTQNPQMEAEVARLKQELRQQTAKLDEANRELFKWRRRMG